MKTLSSFLRRFAGRMIAALVLVTTLLSPLSPGVSVASAATGINRQVSYQARLLDTSGSPVADGVYQLKLSLYDASSAGTRLWTATGTTLLPTALPITVANGLFTIYLGDTSAAGGWQNALDGIDWYTDNIYLGVTVDADAEMSPRKRFTASPYAFNAERLQGMYASSSAFGTANVFTLNQTSNTAATGTRSTLEVRSSGTSNQNDFLIRGINDLNSPVFTVNRQGNVTSTGVFATEAVFTNSSSTNLNALNLTATNVTLLGGTAILSAATSTQFIFTSATGTVLSLTTLTATNGVVTNVTSTNFAGTNVTWTSATGTNTTSTNLFAANLTGTNASLTALLVAGQSVCLADGTNCLPGGSSSTPTLQQVLNQGNTATTTMTFGGGTSTGNFVTTNLSVTSSAIIANLLATNATSTNTTGTNAYFANLAGLSASFTTLLVAGQSPCLADGTNCLPTAPSTSTLQSVTNQGNTTTNAIQFAGGTSTGNFVMTNFVANTGTTTNATSTNLFATNLLATNATSTGWLGFATASGTTLNALNLNSSNVAITGGAVNGTVIGNLTPAAATFTDVTSTSATATNLFATNASLTNLVSVDGSFTRVTSTQWLGFATASGTNLAWINATGTNTTGTNAYFANLAGVSASFTSLLVAGQTVCLTDGTNCPPSGSATTPTLQQVLNQGSVATSTMEFGGGTSTGNFVTTNLNVTGTATILNSTTTNATSTNLATVNFLVTNINGTNATVTNATTSNLASTNALVTNLNGTNATVTNAVFSQATSTNLFATTASSTNLTALNLTSNNVTILGGSIDNTTIGATGASTGVFTMVTTTQATTTNLAVTGAARLSTDSRVNGVLICLADGTNCVASTGDSVWFDNGQLIRPNTTTRSVVMGSSATSTGAPVYFESTGAQTGSSTLYVGFATNTNLVVGTTTNVIVGMNPAFTLNGNDVYVEGNIGSASSVYTNGEFVVGTGTTRIADGLITKTNGDLSLAISGGFLLPNADLAISLGSSTLRFNGLFGSVTTTNATSTNFFATNLTGTSASFTSLTVTGKLPCLADGTNCLATVLPSSITLTPGLTQLSSTALGHQAAQAFTRGDLAYFINPGNTTMSVYDISNPASPLLQTSGLGLGARNADVVGDLLVLGRDYPLSLTFVDMSNPKGPVNLNPSGFANAPIGNNRVVTHGNFAYISGAGLIESVDISDPTRPIGVASTTLSGGAAYGFDTDGRYVYYVNDSLFGVVDVRNPKAMVQVYTTTTPSTDWDYDLAVQGGYAYLPQAGTTTVRILDVTSSTAAIFVKDINLGATNIVPEEYPLEVSGGYLYVGHANGISVYNITNPASPTFVTSTALTGAHALALNGQTLAAVDSANSLRLYDLGGLDTNSVVADGAMVGNLQVRDRATVNADLAVRGSVTVGEGGISSQGAINVGGVGVTSTFHGSLNVAQNFTVSGTAVCLADGTNCLGGGGSSATPTLQQVLNQGNTATTTMTFGGGTSTGNFVTTNLNVTGTATTTNLFATNVTTTNVTTTNLFGATVSSTSITALSLNANNVTILAGNAVLTAATTTQLIFTDATGTTLNLATLTATNINLTDLVWANATGTNTTSSFLFADTASSTNLTALNATAGWLGFTTASGSELNAIRGQFTNVTSTNWLGFATASGTTLNALNLNGTNALFVQGTSTNWFGFATASGTNLFSVNATSGYTFAEFASSTNLFSTNATTGFAFADTASSTNLFSTYATTGYSFAEFASSTNLFSTYATSGYTFAEFASSTNLFSTYATTGYSFAEFASSTNLFSTYATSGYTFAEFASSTNLFSTNATTGFAFADTASSTNLFSTYASFAGVTSTDWLGFEIASGTTLNALNLNFANANFVQGTSTEWFGFATASGTNLFAVNATSGYTFAEFASSTNLFSTYATTGFAFADTASSTNLFSTFATSGYSFAEFASSTNLFSTYATSGYTFAEFASSTNLFSTNATTGFAFADTASSTNLFSTYGSFAGVTSTDWLGFEIASGTTLNALNLNIANANFVQGTSTEWFGFATASGTNLFAVNATSGYTFAEFASSTNLFSTYATSGYAFAEFASSTNLFSTYATTGYSFAEFASSTNLFSTYATTGYSFAEFASSTNLFSTYATTGYSFAEFASSTNLFSTYATTGYSFAEFASSTNLFSTYATTGFAFADTASSTNLFSTYGTFAGVTSTDWLGFEIASGTTLNALNLNIANANFVHGTSTEWFGFATASGTNLFAVNATSGYTFAEFASSTNLFSTYATTGYSFAEFASSTNLFSTYATTGYAFAEFASSTNLFSTYATSGYSFAEFASSTYNNSLFTTTTNLAVVSQDGVWGSYFTNAVVGPNQALPGAADFTMAIAYNGAARAGLCLDDTNDAGDCLASAGVSIQADGAINASAFDIAEWYQASGSVTSSDVLILDTAVTSTVKVSEAVAYDSRIIGIASTKPGFLLGDTGDVMVALSGRVPTKVSMANGTVRIGDLLTTSPYPGYAMKATKPGMTVGYALENLNATGTMEVFVKVGYSAGSVTVASVMNPLVDSNEVTFKGSAWNAVSSTAIMSQFSLLNDVLSATQTQFTVLNTTGTAVSALTQVGDLMIAGRLYPGSRTGMQSDWYIFTDDSTPSLTYMATNADGWQANDSYDFAERYYSPEPLEAGDLVVASRSGRLHVQKSSMTNELMMGIVSTKPGFVAGRPTTNTYPIALVGRVPTKVSTMNGEIRVNDPLGPSTIPGVAMKVTGSGPIVGYALEDYAEANVGLIEVYVNPGWFGGAVTTNSAARRGFATMLAGTKQAQVRFSSIKGYPNVTVTPYGEVGSWWVKDVTDQGFTIVMSQPLAQDMRFAWQAEPIE